MIASVRHSGIVVNDLSKFEHFFECLGFTTIYSETEKGDDIETLLGSNQMIEIIKMEDKHQNVVEFLKYIRLKSETPSIEPPWASGVNHIALTVNSLRSAIDLFLKFNGKLVGEIVEKKSVRLCYIRDFEYNIFELVEEK